ncbi:MAG: AAA family ATPase [Candidatus Magasanikbacteria bacterium]|nr:AAA family ATPase [Candidatus Magasanikbacteria bacterium]
MYTDPTMGRIIAVVNQKGGVGKTTTALNLAAYLADKGKFVLLVDVDPQANATSGIGHNYRELECGLYDALVGVKALRDVIHPTVIDGFRIAPATPSLAGANVELVNVDRREFRLRDMLEEMAPAYDYIIIDCPPSLGLLTVNSLVAAHEVLIPVQAEYYALEGLGQLLETLDLVRENINPNLKILGAVITMFDNRNKLSKDVDEELRKFFPNKIFSTVIPRNVKLAEAPSFGKVIMHYDKFSRGAVAYSSLADEVLEIHKLEDAAKEPVKNFVL